MKHYSVKTIKQLIPETMGELSDILKEFSPNGKIISGGTDLIISMNQGLYKPDALLYIGEIEGVRDIKLTPESIEIGAMATMSDLACCEELTGPYAALKHAAADVGSVQIRNTATIGGNIANASPAGDIAPVLYLLQAEAIITGGTDTRRVTITQVIKGSAKTSLQYNEVITGVVLPKKWKDTAKSVFNKLGYRKTLTISRIGLGILFDFDFDGTINYADVIAGAIAPVPVHVKKAEQFLIGKKPSPTTAKETGRFLSELILEITLEEFDRNYKISAAYGVAEDVIKRF